MTTGAIRDWSHRHWREALLVAVGFITLAIVLTWPVAVHVSTIIPSPGYAWDPAGYIWDFWERAREGMALWGESVTHLVGIPFGRTGPAIIDVTQLFTYGPAMIITMIAGPVVAYNALILAGLTCAGVATYALVRWLGCSAAVAAWAGAAYAMCPYALGKAINHVPLVQIACFPIAILAALWWSERTSWRRALVVTAALGMAWLTHPYYGLMVTVVLVVVCGGGAIRVWRTQGAGAATKSVAWVSGFAVLCVGIPVLAIGMSASSAAGAGTARQAVELDYYGARLSDFLSPPANSILMKGLNADWQGVIASSDERTILYVGISVIIIALTGAITTWRSPNPRLRLATRTAAVLVPLLAWFSLASPTTLLGIHIPVPSLWIWEVAPQFRVFARFAAPLMCALLILGAIGLQWLANRGGTPWKVSVIAGVAFVTLLDLASGIPVPTATPVISLMPGRSLADTPTWRWLAANPAPGGVIAYPTTPEAYGRLFESRERVPAFGQTVHGRPMVNGVLNPAAVANDFLTSVRDPNQPGVANALATAGVRFATVDQSAYAVIGSPVTVDVFHPPAGFAMERVFADGTAIWRVTAQPRAGVVVFRPPGFRTDVTPGATTWYPFVQSPATIAIWARKDGTYRVTLPVRGIAPPLITCTSADGAPPTLTASGHAVTLTLAVGTAGREVQFDVPGGVPAGAAIGSGTLTAVP
jgi:hypothetical protein